MVYVATRQPNLVGNFPFIGNMPKAILIYFVTTFFQSLLYIEILLIWINSQMIDIQLISSHTVGVLLWTLKGMIIESALCVSSNMLYQSITACQISMCSGVRKSQTVQQFTKNILRTRRVNFSKISAFGIFNVDAALPLRMGALITTYTIVLLQFAFL
ncbi:uncharacterized protein LOC113511266 [Galleria mellonella]|uniref:Uncharacterized protein LOC113511266 n=1 Tax=Galleria mellonella TaxID=7137 RepID=A0ABM3M9A2_GALME|nr:uncharacterized protein LOC113511266 [Galleria mellonella]